MTRLCMAFVLLLSTPAAGRERPIGQLINQAQQDLGRDDVDAAIAALTEAVRRDPVEGFGWALLAEAYAYGRGWGPETIAAWRAHAEHTADPRDAVAAIHAVVASHQADKWVTPDSDWVIETLAELAALIDDPATPVEARYMALIARRGLRYRIGDGDGALSDGLAAHAAIPDRLQGRNAAMQQAVKAGDLRAADKLCASFVQRDPWAVEACSMVWGGSAWSDQTALDTLRARIGVSVGKLEKQALADPVLANEMLKFWERSKQPEKREDFLRRAVAVWPRFVFSDSDGWALRARPGPVAEADAALAVGELALARGDEAAARQAADRARTSLLSAPYDGRTTRGKRTFGEELERRRGLVARADALTGRAEMEAGKLEAAWAALVLAADTGDATTDAAIWRAIGELAELRGDLAWAREADLELAALARPVDADPDWASAALQRFRSGRPEAATWHEDAVRAAFWAAAAVRRGEQGREEGAREEVHPLVGKPAPELPMQHPDGRERAFSDLRGDVIVLDFWATWCGPCKQAMPELDGAQRALGADARFVSLSVDEARETVATWLQGTSYSLDFAWLPDRDVQRRWGVRGIPMLFVIDRDGIVRYAHSGYRRGMGDTVVAEVKKLVGG